MKKVLLFSIILFSFFITLSVYAYETIIIDFPPKTKWNVAYYKKINSEAILQYVPDGQTLHSWKQAVIVHSYKDNDLAANTLAQRLAAQMMKQNPTGAYKYLRIASFDTVAVRMTNDFKGIKGQGEIFRTTKAAEGMMTIQYVDRDKEHFRQNYNVWLKIIKDARTYNSYWLDDRIQNKSESLQL